MGKHNRLSRDQKRRAKLAKEARKARTRTSLAYKGGKYKTPELVNVIFHTERAIYEAWVMTDRQLTDRDVEASLEQLILQMREGPLPPLEEAGDDDEKDLIVWNIGRHWEELFRTEPHPGLERLTGVLRTILGSIEVWSTPSPDSRGYLSYVEGFLRKAGVSTKISPDTELALEEPEEDDLMALGQTWCHGTDPEAAADFRAMAENLIRSSDPAALEEVAEVCQGLLNEAPTQEVRAELSKLALWAHQKLRREPG
jgi:hypothetical protein